MGQPWREVPLCLLSKRSSEVAARAPARGGRRRRGSSFSQSEADDRDDGRAAVSAAPSARVPPAGSAAAPGLPRRRGSRSTVIRGGRGSARPRAHLARIRVHHQRVHQSSPATGADKFTRLNLLDEPLADALLLRVGRLEAVLERRRPRNAFVAVAVGECIIVACMLLFAWRDFGGC